MTPATPAPLVGSARRESLRAEIAGFQGLLTVLEAEANALRRADADALSILCNAKLERVASLQALARERTQQMKRAGMAGDLAGVKGWLEQAGEVTAVRDDWDRLTQLALEAKRQNDINGRLAARQRWHFDAALGALLQAAGVSSIYGADGRTRRTTVTQFHLSV